MNPNLPPLWLKRYRRVKILATFGLPGVALIIAGFAVEFLQPEQNWPLIIGALAFFPLAVYCKVLTILHWKERYRGSNSTAWGAVMILEQSGWSNLIYWFRHIMPDWRNRGRYLTA